MVGAAPFRGEKSPRRRLLGGHQLKCLVNERRRELAIRLALGAQPGALARLVTAQGLALTGAGVVLGLLLAQLARGMLRAVLFETRPTDSSSRSQS